MQSPMKSDRIVITTKTGTSVCSLASSSSFTKATASPCPSEPRVFWNRNNSSNWSTTTSRLSAGGRRACRTASTRPRAPRRSATSTSIAPGTLVGLAGMSRTSGSASAAASSSKRVAARAHDGDPPARAGLHHLAAVERRHEAATDERRLAAARRPDDGEKAVEPKTAQQLVHLRLPAEEQVVFRRPRTGEARGTGYPRRRRSRHRLATSGAQGVDERLAALPGRSRPIGRRRCSNGCGTAPWPACAAALAARTPPARPWCGRSRDSSAPR